MSHLSLHFLGSPLIELDGVEVAIDRKKAIALLAYLAISRTSHNRNNLAALLWPSYDQTHARASLRYTISLLRKTLGEEWFDVDREQIGLNRSERLRLDVDRFHTLLAGCREHNHQGDEVCPDCTNPLTEAVELYRGDFMTGFGLKDSPEFDDWQFLQAQSLHHELAGALEKLVRCQISAKEFEGAIGYSRRWLEFDGGNEAAHRCLMESYAWAGQRTEALRQYRECERILKEEMGVSPQEETVRLFQAIKEDVSPPERSFSTESEVAVAESTPIPKPPDNPSHNLPRQLTSFIGREGEMEEVRRLLTDTYLLTLTGAGGCGKTRLALEVVSHLVDEYADGVWLVELGSLSDPGLVPQKVAAVLDVREQPGHPLSDTLADYLRAKNLLLLLDNCEHLIEACATLAEALLQTCANLKILATSREGLDIPGEMTYRVPSLSLPDPQQLPQLEYIRQYEAINLFIERTTFNQPTFTLTDRNAPVIAQICQRLDGIPLAIELAAARVKALSVEQIGARLEDSFRLLKGGSRTALPRQQTLRATIDWSYNLLTAPERKLLNRLSVFRGGWTLEAAEEVCSGKGVETDEVLDLLTQIVNKSMVVMEEVSSGEEGGGETRYRLLETVRGYGLERLAESGEEEAIRQHHASFFLALAEEAGPELHGPDQVEWLGRLKGELDNLRAALQWNKSENNFEAGLRLAGALWWFWNTAGIASEGREWLEGTLRRPSVAERSGVSDSVLTKALASAGVLAGIQGDSDRAVELCEEGLILARELGDKKDIAFSLTNLGAVKYFRGEFEQARQYAEEGIALSREVGDKWLLASSLRILGVVWNLSLDKGYLM